MNAALPVEEAYIILTDEKQNGHLVLLDAKTAFDKVKGRGTLVRSSFYLFLFLFLLFVFIYFIFFFNSDFSWLDSATRYLNKA